MPLDLKKRWPEWRLVASIYLENGGSFISMVRHMAKALWAGPVPREVWRHRILRGCNGCPVFDREVQEDVNGRKWRLNACAGPHGTGCGCWVVTLAMSANPSGNGCWLHTVNDGVGGWPAYRFPTVWHRLFAPIRFLFGK